MRKKTSNSKGTRDKGQDDGTADEQSDAGKRGTETKRLGLWGKTLEKRQLEIEILSGYR